MMTEARALKNWVLIAHNQPVAACLIQVTDVIPISHHLAFSYQILPWTVEGPVCGVPSAG